MIESVCSNCGNKKVFEDDKLGKKFKCPSCSTTIVIEKVIATAAMHDEVVLDVKEVQMSGFEKWVFNLTFINGVLVLGISSLIIAGIISTLGYNILFTSQSGVESHGVGHEGVGIFFMVIYITLGLGYGYYIKKIKKF